MNNERRKTALRLVATASALLLFCAALSGCGCSKQPNGGTVTILPTTTKTAVTTAAQTATATKVADTSSAPTTTKASVSPMSLSEDDCRSLSIGGGTFYYAIAYPQTGTALQKRLAAAIEQLDKDGTLAGITDEWFCGEVFPRDGRCAASTDATDSAWEKIQATGILRIGVNANLHAGEADVCAYEQAVARAAGKKLGLSVTFVQVSDIATAFESADCLWGGWRMGEQSEVAYSALNEWSLENGMCYYTLKGTRFGGETALWNMDETLALVQGTFASDFMKERLAKTDHRIAVRECRSARTAFEALERGEVYAVAVEYLTAYRMWKAER